MAGGTAAGFNRRVSPDPITFRLAWDAEQTHKLIAKAAIIFFILFLLDLFMFFVTGQ